MPTSLYNTCLQHDTKWPSNLIKLVNKEPITLRSVMQLYLIMSLNLYQQLSRDISKYSTPKNHAHGSRSYILKLTSLHWHGGNIRFPGAREVAMRGMGYVDHKVQQRNEITTTTEQNTTTNSLSKIHCKTRPDPRQEPSLKKASDTRVHSRYLVHIVLSITKTDIAYHKARHYCKDSLSRCVYRKYHMIIIDKISLIIYHFSERDMCYDWVRKGYF